MDKIYISAYADDSFGTLSHAKFTTFQPDKPSMGRPAEKLKSFSESATANIKKSYDRFIEYESKVQPIMDKALRLKNTALNLKKVSSSYSTTAQDKYTKLGKVRKEFVAGAEANEALEDARRKLQDYGNEWNNCKVIMLQCLEDIEAQSKFVTSLSGIIPNTLDSMKKRYHSLFSNNVENPFKMENALK